MSDMEDGADLSAGEDITPPVQYSAYHRPVACREQLIIAGKLDDELPSEIDPPTVCKAAQEHDHQE